MRILRVREKLRGFKQKETGDDDEANIGYPINMIIDKIKDYQIVVR